MTRSDELVLTVGDNTAFVLLLFDDADAPEDLSAATRARLIVDTEAGSGSPLLDIDTDTELTIGASQITAQMSTAQADALVPGRYIAMLSVEFGAGVWRKSDEFYCLVQADVAPNLA